MSNDWHHGVEDDAAERLKSGKPLQRMIPVPMHFLQMVAAFAEDVSSFTPKDVDAFTAYDLASEVDDILRKANAS